MYSKSHIDLQSCFYCKIASNSIYKICCISNKEFYLLKRDVQGWTSESKMRKFMFSGLNYLFFSFFEIFIPFYIIHMVPCVAATFQLYFYKFIRGYISLHVYFETLLMLLSEIDTSNLTLFLVDEISTPSRKKFISKIVFGKNATIF